LYPNFFIILCELNWDAKLNECELWDITVLRPRTVMAAVSHIKWVLEEMVFPYVQ